MRTSHRKSLGLSLTTILVVLFIQPVFAVSDARPYYRAELIFKPSLQFPRCHASTIAALTDGCLLAAWWNGSEETGKDLVIRAARRPSGKDRWEPPFILADTPDTSDGVPVLFVASNDELWLFYRAGIPPVKLMWRKSADMGKTWDKPEIFLDEPLWAFRSRPLSLANGDIFVPLHKHVCSGFIFTTDAGKSWTLIEEIKTEPRSNEPTIIQKTDGSLLAFIRPYDPEPADRFLWQSESFDISRTWSKPIRTRIKNPSSAAQLLKLQNGHVVLVFNNSQEGRSPLCLALSLDEGKSWNYMRVLEDASGRFSYPTLTQSADGLIHISYTFRRTHIKHAEVNEAWIMEKPWDDYPD